MSIYVWARFISHVVFLFNLFQELVTLVAILFFFPKDGVNFVAVRVVRYVI